MAIKIRLARGGSKKRPYYRIVVADARSPRDGRFIERVGSYNPLLPNDNEQRIILNEDRIKHWISNGAQPTDRVARFLGQANIIEMPKVPAQTKKNQMKQKALERLEEKKAAEEASKEAAAEAEA